MIINIVLINIITLFVIIIIMTNKIIALRFVSYNAKTFCIGNRQFLPMVFANRNNSNNQKQFNNNTR